MPGNRTTSHSATDFGKLPGAAASVAGSDSASVLHKVRRRPRARHRRRGQAPAWIQWLARKAGTLRAFLTQTVPGYAADHREEVLTTSVSFVAHLFVALILAFWMLPPEALDGWGILSTRVVEEDPPEVVDVQDVVQPDSLKDLEVESQLQQLVSAIEDGRNTDVLKEIQEQDLALDLEPVDADIQRLFKEGDFGGRTGLGRKAAVKRFGGTVESERAVNLGLKWLAGIQRQDGSWSYDDVGAEAQPGSLNTTQMGATSMALLCFLGAGHSHATDGPYKDVVLNGLKYLGRNAVVSQGLADMRGNAQGNSGMYVQGLATICLTEAHALEPDDTDITKMAGMAVAFIERAQDPRGGGWRYQPRQKGDTSVVGWQVMALRSAKSGGLRVDNSVLRDARNFLVSVQTHGGARYTYMPERDHGSIPTMTAVGLLCRMYMGWRQDTEALKEGVEYLSAIGPSSNDIYYNYYATQVVHHWGGDVWTKWNNRMRDQLVETQIQDGPAAGSWPVTDPHGGSAGQLYQTTLSILTLEVYYRHLPLYRQLDE
ncbi:MAG: prenyltransferase/squalene oxidase repeat-containing protein [Planctomycetaceae bacterium]